jgi:hypothetical protein
MSQASGFLGQGTDTSVFTPRTLTHNGELRCCIGIDTRSSTRKWFGVKGHSAESLSFCEYCAKHGFNQDELFEVNEENLVPRLVCDAPYTNKVSRLIGDRRTVRYNGVKINGNVIDEDDQEWSPILKLRDPGSQSAAKAGVLRLNMPSGSYWEYVVQIDEKGPYFKSNYFFSVTAKTDDGRSITKSNQHGRTGILYPAVVHGSDPYQACFNAYNSGEDSRFFFLAPADQELEAGIEAEHNNKSNIFRITVHIHQEIKPQPKSEVKYRGGATRGGATRGGAPLTRGGGLSGGSNFSASGVSATESTVQSKSTFPIIDTIHLTLQLVNNEPNEQRLHVAKTFQEQHDSWRLREIEKLRVGSSRSQVLGLGTLSHAEQSSHLI